MISYAWCLNDSAQMCPCTSGKLQSKKTAGGFQNCSKAIQNNLIKLTITRAPINSLYTYDLQGICLIMNEVYGYYNTKHLDGMFYNF